MKNIISYICSAVLVLQIQTALAQDAAHSDRNSFNTSASHSGMLADSPVKFPSKGPLPSLFPPDLKEETLPVEEGYFLFFSPCRSISQIDAIQAAMPTGGFTPPPADWQNLARTRRILMEGGELRVLALGDSIINDIMHSAWVAKLAEAYPKASINTTVYVRGGGGCHHYAEEGRIAKYLLPRKPDLVFIGGISQRDTYSIFRVIREIRKALPNIEFLLTTGAFGTCDPRNGIELANAPHSGTGPYGKALRSLAKEEHCAYLDITTPWAEYIQSSKKHPHLFYRDVIHANEYGEQILGKIMLAFFTAPPASQAAHP